MVAISQPPIWLQNGTYSAKLDRNLIDLFFTEGVLAPGAGDYEVGQSSPVSNSVLIQPGRAIITGDDEADQGKYLCKSTGILTLALNAAPVADARIDLIYLRVNDSTAGGPAGDNATVEFLEGTVAPSPVAPAIPTSAIGLAEILRTVGDTYIDTGMITDIRTPSSGQTFTVRSNFEVLTTAQRNLLTPYVGESIYNTDDNYVQVYNGSQWFDVGSTFFEALTTAQRNALPSPYAGQTILNTDLNALQFYDGAAWQDVNQDPIGLIIALS